MAKLASLKIGLYVNEGDEATPDWTLISCSTADGFNLTTDNTEIATKCNNGFKENLPASSSWSMSNSGYAETELGEGKASYALVEELARTRAVKQYKLAHLDDETLYYRMGYGYASSYSEASDEGDYMQFDTEITGTGEYVVTPPAV